MESYFLGIVRAHTQTHTCAMRGNVLLGGLRTLAQENTDISREFAILPRKAINSQINLPPSPHSLSWMCKPSQKTKEIALRVVGEAGEEGGGISARSAQRLLCMSASSDTNYAGAERMCLNVRPPLQPPPPHPPRTTTTILHPPSAPLPPSPHPHSPNPLPDSRSYP